MLMVHRFLDPPNVFAIDWQATTAMVGNDLALLPIPLQRSYRYMLFRDQGIAFRAGNKAKRIVVFNLYDDQWGDGFCPFRRLF